MTLERYGMVAASDRKMEGTLIVKMDIITTKVERVSMNGMGRWNILCINYRLHKNSMPKLHEGMGGPKQRFNVEEIYVRDAALRCYGWSVALQRCISNIVGPLIPSRSLGMEFFHTLYMKHFFLSAGILLGRLLGF
jgi:hypothetical protein